jgi:hypothetical protein
LIKIAKALNDLEREGQDKCEGYEIDTDIAMGFNSDFVLPEREPNVFSENTIGEYTYHKLSRIPKVDEFNNKEYGIKGKEFKKIFDDMENKTGQEMADEFNTLESKLSFEQRDRYQAEMWRIANSKAGKHPKFKYTLCEPALEPQEDPETLPLMETGHQAWSLETESGLDRATPDQEMEFEDWLATELAS